MPFRARWWSGCWIYFSEIARVKLFIMLTKNKYVSSLEDLEFDVIVMPQYFFDENLMAMVNVTV